MASLDTNVLVRYLTQDDEAQFTIANQVIHHFDMSVFIPITVILELEWVLRSRYKFGKDKLLVHSTSYCRLKVLPLQMKKAWKWRYYYSLKILLILPIIRIPLSPNLPTKTRF